MGKRVNFAALAEEEVPDFAPTPQPSIPTATTPALATIPREQIDATSDPTQLPESVLPIADIAGNPLNRPGADDETDDDDFRDLVDTIRTHGVLQPILVCSSDAFAERYPEYRQAIDGSKWVALIGNRRLKAATEAGLTEVPAVVNDERVTSMYEVMLVENGHRKNLAPLDEAQAMARVIDEGVSQKELARRIGRSAMYVSQRVALLGLIPELRDALRVGILKVELARQFGTLPEDEQRAIVEAGQPYRRPSVTEQARSRSTRRISAATPQQAADSIRKLFSPDELTELIRLLGARD